MSNRLLLILTILVGVFVTAIRFWPKDELSKGEFGREFNPMRDQLGLPIIEDSWTIRSSDSSSVRWMSSVNEAQNEHPVHLWKTVWVKNSTLLSEEDAFNLLIKNKVLYRLILRNDFDGDNRHVKFEFIINYFDRYPANFHLNVDKRYADSVLSNWGFRNSKSH